MKKEGIKDYVLINSFNPTYLSRPSSIKPRPALSIYQCVDNIAGEPYIARHGVRMEKVCIRNYDHTIVTSKGLLNKYRDIAPAITWIPNGANTGNFLNVDSKAPAPDEIASAGRPVVVYMGNIGLRIDYTMIAAAARAHPEFLFLMIGPRDPLYFGGQELEKISNIRFTGPKTPTELAIYLKYAQAGIIPFEKSDLTYHIYPLKINEYLASGIPVVSTDFADLEGFEEYIYTAHNQEEFNSLIARAVAEDSQEKRLQRQKYASGNDWKGRGEQLKRLINEQLAKKARS